MAAMMAILPKTGLFAAEETLQPVGQLAFALDGNKLRLLPENSLNKRYL